MTLKLQVKDRVTFKCLIKSSKELQTFYKLKLKQLCTNVKYGALMSK